MERILHYHIDSTCSGLRVEQYLRRKGYSCQNLTQLKRMHESILINGVWSYMRTPLQTSDTLTVHIQEDTSSPNIPPSDLPLEIIYEDEDIVVVNKPAGMPVHPSLDNFRNSLANAHAYYYTQQGKSFVFRCTNRLDRDTSGLTVIAKHMVSSRHLIRHGCPPRDRAGISCDRQRERHPRHRDNQCPHRPRRYGRISYQTGSRL